MKKILLLIVVIFVLSCALFLCGCTNGGLQSGEDKISQATDTITKVLDSNEEKRIIVSGNSQTSVRENCNLTLANATVANGVFVKSGLERSSFYIARAVSLNSEKPLLEFELPIENLYNTSRINIRLTDIFDENNFIEVQFAPAQNIYWSIVSAKCTKTNQYFGVNNLSHGGKDNGGTTFLGNNFNGEWSNNNGHYPFNVGFDPEKGEVFIFQNAVEKTKVVNLSDENVVGTGNGFKGFSSDKVYLRVEFAKITGTGGILLTKIGGQSLSGNIDYTVPVDNLKLKMVDGTNIFEGAVGYKYKLPVPVEEDFLFGNENVKIKLTAPDGVEQKVNIDNSFTPDSVGTYNVEYSSKDVFGNTNKKIFNIPVKAEPAEITFDFEEKSLRLGEKYSLPNVTVRGGNGSVETQIKYTYNEEVISSDSITLKKPGSIKLIAVATDKIGHSKTETKEYVIINTRFLDVKSDLPYYVVCGDTVDLPGFTAFDYINEEEMIKSIYVNGNAVTDGKYNVTAADGNTLSVVYYGNKGTEDEVKKEFKVGVISPAEKTDISSYFDYDKTEISGTTSGSQVTFRSLKQQEKTVIKYPFALSTSMLEIYLKFDATADFGYLRIILDDVARNGRRLYFDLYTTSGTMKIRYPDASGGIKEMDVAKNVKDFSTFIVYYNYEDNSLIDYAYNRILKFEYDSEGNRFSGFEASAAYLSFELHKANINSSFGVISLSNQFFNTDAYSDGDKSVPVITFDKPLKTSGLLYGDTLVIPAALGYDALSNQPFNVYCRVMRNGKIIFKNVCLTEEIKVNLEEYGTYIITCTSSDNSFNAATVEVVFKIADNVPPVISVGNVNTRASVNKEFTFSGYDVTDNVSASDKIEKYVIVKDLGKGGYVAVAIGDKYVFTEKGVYECSYYARDELGNVGTYKFNVTVE